MLSCQPPSLSTAAGRQAGRQAGKQAGRRAYRQPARRTPHRQTPGAAAQDMMLVWSNCALYNKPTAAVGQAGLNARKHFEELWERSKLGEGLRNPRRSTAGQAPSKWEGDDQPRDQAAPSSSARSARPPPVRLLFMLTFLLLPFPPRRC